MSEKIKKSLPYLTIFTVPLIFTLMFIFRQTLFAGDVGFSGGGAGRTTIVTETDEKCKEPGIEICIEHTHEFDWDDEIVEFCVPASYTASIDKTTYCVGEEIIVAVSKTGDNTLGKSLRVWTDCTYPGCTEPHSPEEEDIPHDKDSTVTWPILGWVSEDCGASGVIDDSVDLKLVAARASSEMNSSSVVFSNEPPGSTGFCPWCGSLSNESFTLNFTVVGVDLVKCEEVISYTNGPGKNETLFLINTGLDFTPTPDLLTKTVSALL